MGFEFVKIGSREIGEVLRVQERAHAAFYQEKAESFISKIEISPDACFGVLSGDKLVGYGISFPWFKDKVVNLDSSLNSIGGKPEILYIHDIAVDPDFRGLGIAKELLRLMLQEAALLGLSSVALVAVSGSNTYWAGHGFIETEGGVDGYGSCAMEMILTLK